MGSVGFVEGELITVCALASPQVDVEGWEWSVIQGAAKMLKQYNVENIIMEYSPGEQGLGLGVRGILLGLV